MNCTGTPEENASAEALGNERQRLHGLLDLCQQDGQWIAHEIHAGMTHRLTAARLHCEMCRELREHDPQKAEDSCEAGFQLLTRAIDEARQQLHGSRPPVLERSGLVGAVDHLVREHRQSGGPRIELVHNLRTSRLSPPLESAVYRIIQESLTNACRHSRSDKVRVELSQTDDHLCITVRDWGIGFDMAKVDKQRLGLHGIRERARMLGGQAVIITAPDLGTQIDVELPLGQPDTGACDP